MFVDDIKTELICPSEVRVCRCSRRSDSLKTEMFLWHVCLQITELLDDERCEAECEELPQDGEEGPASPDSSQHTHTDDSTSAR